jgi:mannose-6-phosphate isomerase-like protein (cupin superfamily)
MADYTAKRVDDMEAGFGGGFVKVRAELGVSAFGFQVIRLPPNFSDYPEHDELHTGQEEVYTALEGSGWIEIDGERVDLDRGMFVRVGPEPKRKIFSGSDGLQLLALGGVEGGVYKPGPNSELGTS